MLRCCRFRPAFLAQGCCRFRPVFTQALVLQSALQFDCESGAVQRIEAAIELLDETVLQTRTIIFGLSTSDGYC